MSGLARRLRGPVLGGLVLVVGAAAAVAPRALRDLDVFRVRQVSVTGTRFIQPYAVVRAAGLTRASSVFDDVERWETGVLTLPLVEAVEIRRRLPGTVEVHVAEVQPVALVAGRELRPVDGNGRVLALDPAGTLLDLPILTGLEVRAGLVHGPAGAAALRSLIELQRSAPQLAERISQVEHRQGALRVVFRDDAAEVLLPVDATGVQLRHLRLAYADLAARGELGNVRRIDLRFRDQVVVSFLSSPVS